MEHAGGQRDRASGHACATDDDQAGGVGSGVNEVKRIVHAVITSVEEHQHQPGQGRVTCAAVGQFDELGRIAAGRVGVQFVDENALCRRRGGREGPAEIGRQLVGRVDGVQVVHQTGGDASVALLAIGQR